ncbi:hypothetical protein [Methanobacterium formicicum]|uniref:hypothetical protein n=1 Tax=Methanobacterium formicicum TaxID=2162 RepID=UPI00064FE76C|nr:hypothetical protein [Methanobacterium formicicum]
MSKELNDVLKRSYIFWKDDPCPPVPLDLIKEYLELEGVSLEDELAQAVFVETKLKEEAK